MRPYLLAAAVAIGQLNAPQRDVVDEGGFVLYLHGRRIGREQFSIRRTTGADGVSLTARATVTFEGRRVESMVRTDTAGGTREFMIEEFDGGRLLSRVSGAVNGPRLVQRATSGGAQSEKEFMFFRGTVVSDSASVYQYYFIVRGAGRGRVPILFPRQQRRDSVSISVRAERQDVELGNGKTLARHLILMDAAGIATDVWLDADGRLLRVAVPSRGFVAVRDAPPA